jgi:hypothetical protein
MCPELRTDAMTGIGLLKQIGSNIGYDKIIIKSARLYTGRFFYAKYR